MNTEIVKILKRELFYRFAKEDPMLTEKDIIAGLKNASNLRRQLMMNLLLVLFGIPIAIPLLLIRSEKAVVMSFMIISTVAMLFAIYGTLLNVPALISLKLFEPLKSLPIKIGSKYLTHLTTLEILPIFMIFIPTLVVIEYKNFIAGVLSFLWLFLSLFFGHALGLAISDVFSLKVSTKPGKELLIARIAESIFGIIIGGAFVLVIMLRGRIIAFLERVYPVVARYQLIYPFSALTIFEPEKSFPLLFIYFAILTPVYFVFLKRVWDKILEPPVISQKVKVRPFKASPTRKSLALVIKDFKLAFRKPMILSYLIMPVFYALIMAYLFFMDSEDSFVVDGTFIIFSMTLTGEIQIETFIGVDSFERSGLQFLKTLPLRKFDLIISKAIDMSIVPILVNIAIVLFVSLHDLRGLYLLLFALLLPPIGALVSLLFVFRYGSEELWFPELKWYHDIIMIALIGMALIPVGLPLLFGGFKWAFASWIIALVELFVLMFIARRL
ncbi:hypothetical protein [Thermococcus paralvinellae]|uniref:Uncharacterized protein n=1 Tax=Thermococcus paralvinellae TaxID=582419 RepID=W0I6F4_9EURY|nr:hypothetical protein [Thermococcus paralvinellae]AHF80015.1 Hypothetical protein TES1_0627 [Thermococcus paralvinellae]